RAIGQEVVASAIADDEGGFVFASVPAGSLQLTVLSETGALFERVQLDAVPADRPTERDILIDPSGVVYDARSGVGISGARAYLYLEDGDDDPSNDRLAGSDRVPVEQQGQITNRDGLYKFDVTPGRYRLGLVPASATQLFPSLLLAPANDDGSTHPYGSYAITDDQHRVVANARPDLKGDTHYYLRFDIAGTADEVLHNHVPLDPLSSHVSLVKSASHKRVSVGDIVTYTVRYANRSPLSLTVADEGGVAVVDAIPHGFKYLKGSSRLEELVRVADGAQHRREVARGDPQGERLLAFGPYDLAAHGEYQLRYQLAVAPNAEFGEHENTAVLRLATSQTDISNVSQARVAVVPDPIFDLGTVIGKVYCDDNKNLAQDQGELPLPGATVYLDTGRHAESDIGGKFHFSGLKPGMHLLKIDRRTLPPGSELTTEERAHIYVTRGLPSRISYGVDCRFDRVSGAQVRTATSRPAEDAAAPAAAVARVSVTGVLTQRTIALDGAEQATVRVDLGLGIGDQDRDYSNGDGPNHGGLDPAAGLTPELHFYPRVITSLPLVRWRLALTDPAGDEIYAFANDGEPPEDLSWDGRDSASGAVLLAAGKEYRAQLSATASNGDWGASAPRVFGTGVGSSTAFVVGYQASIDEVAGPLFDKRDRPTPRLREFIKKTARELVGHPDPRIAVAVHTDDRAGSGGVAAGSPGADPAAAARQLTQRRAERVASDLGKAGVAAARIEALGEGDQSPLVPNLGKRNRSRNRRVEVRTTAAALRGPPLPHVEYPGRVSVNGVEVTDLAPSTAFAHQVEVAIGDTVAIDLTAPSGGRVVLSRVYTGSPFPVGAPPPPGSIGVAVSGDVGARTLQIAEERRSMALLDTRVDLEGEATTPAIAIGKTGLERELVWIPAVPAGETIARWRLIVFTPPASTPATGSPVPAAPAGSGGDEPLPPLEPLVVPEAASSSAPEFSAGALVDPFAAIASDRPAEPPPTPIGAVIKEFAGEWPPVGPLQWRGEGDNGAMLLRPGRYGYRLEVEAVDGSRAYSAPGYFDVVGDAVVERLTLADPFAGERRKLALKDVAALRALLSRHPDPALRLRVVAHTDDQQPRDKAAGLTRDWAEQTKRALVAAGVDAERIDAIGMGSSDPMLPNVNRRNRARNRRVVVEVMSAATGAAVPDAKDAKAAVAAAASGAIFVEANGLAVPAPLGAFETTAFVAREGLLQLRVVLPTGAEAIWIYRPDVPEVKTGSEALVTAGGVDGGPSVAGEEDGGASAIMLAPPLVAAPGGEEFMPFEPSSAPLVAIPGEDGGAMALTEEPAAAAVDGGPGFDAAGVRAAQLTVDLPLAGAIVRANRLPIRGFTAPGNRVSVNGKPVDVDARSGQFAALVDLPEGRSVLRIEAVDEDGNVGVIERGIEVDSNGLFALVLADSSLADRNADLPEWNGYNHLKLGGVALYGRGAALLKGRWTSDSFFKRYDFTLHVDTARWNEDSFEHELLDPERYYPTYADSSLEVIDAEARYPLYAELRADDSYLRVGNFRTRLEGGDLFRYDRARYGMVLKFDRALGQLESGTVVLDNDVSAFVAGGDAPRRHARIELRGTGGSLYYLAHDTVVEGSEQVAIVVRDGITGSELYRRPLTRNIDYTIRYREGRIVLTAMLSSTAESGWIANQNLSTVYAGHPVYLAVEYEHEGAGDYNELGAGLAVSETVLEHVTVGGGYVYEGRADERPAFQLAGTHLKLAYDARTFIQGEWAYSRSVSMDNYVSDDGGLSFRRLGQQVDDGAVLMGRMLFPAEREGHAFKVRGQTSLGGLWGGAPDDLALRAHFQRMAPGFSTGVSAIEAGQTKYGVEGRWLITRRDRLELRYDGIWSDIAQVAQSTEYRTLHRELATLQYQRRQETLTLTGEYAFAYSWDSGAYGQNAFAQERTVLGNVAAA
ncbi:MAG: OmpA family protein, partial [Deltaproteobacteria bacterium]|nr:OmpA family protein [Deltaproteobacteria bacterium]